MEQFLIFLGFVVVIAIVLFLPALFELKKPKDVGPRKIIGFEHGMLLQAEKEEIVFSKQPGSGALAALDSLPNLEVNSSIS